MLQNAYFVAKIGTDTAENEQHFAEILPTDARGRPAGGGRAGRVPVGVAEVLGVRVEEDDEVARARVVEQHAGHPRSPPTDFENAFFENAFFENAFFENFANFWRARSRLYQNEILQENMRLTAFFKLYKICILLHRCCLLYTSPSPRD